MSLPEEEVLSFFQNLNKGETFQYKEVGSDCLVESKFCAIDDSRSSPGVKVIVHIPHGCLIFKCRQKTKGFAFLQLHNSNTVKEEQPTVTDPVQS